METTTLKLSGKKIARYIDHTILKADATADDVRKICAEAVEYNFFSVCVNPCFVALVAECVKESDVKVCSVIGFPLGCSTTKIKAREARKAIKDGADEIDMVIHVGSMKSADYEYVKKDISKVAGECKAGGALLKVILETCLLTDEEKVKACELCIDAGADFVKTSTGFSTGGATAEDIALMSKCVSGKKLGVKASGGVRTYADAVKMIEAGATRIGSSNGKAIVEQAGA